MRKGRSAAPTLPVLAKRRAAHCGSVPVKRDPHFGVADPRGGILARRVPKAGVKRRCQKAERPIPAQRENGGPIVTLATRAPNKLSSCAREGLEPAAVAATSAAINRFAKRRAI